ncbi:cpw-wpc domain-containing, putative [Babesia ovis]|uniref:Cpw-wpc domain-containing, putative n=1 Tax=Babesia ovis TaxID=5869 RepID=A0A9W5TBJ6_BABOV|nr:cpw-wpc domain-containing, putative [Babesia ovis]
MWKVALFGATYALLFAPCGVLGRDDFLKLEIPENHATQELYKAFVKEPKEEHVTERMSDLVAAAASEKTGTICEAPSSYKGDCARSVDMSDFTMERKMLFMADCKVKWPCKSTIDKADAQYCKDTERNFLQPCPENFLRHKQDSGYVCVPDFAGYVGPCRSVVDFTNFSKESKMIWAQSCGTTWPCMTICPKVFDKCPLDWKLAPDGACDAPASYNGPCEKRIHFTYYTQEMKRKKCVECDIAFECSSECQKDYSKCPVLWKTEADGYCVPPSGTMNCNDILAELLKETGHPEAATNHSVLDLRLLDAESRKLFESKCNNLEFPCMEQEDDINWSLQCPRGWTISKDDLRSCKPPVVNDDDVCKSPALFNDEEEKRAFASLCQIRWSGANAASDVTSTSTTTAEIEHRIDGPITDIGIIHSLNQKQDSSLPSRHGGTSGTTPLQQEPKEQTITYNRKRTIYNVGPFVVRKTGQPNRRLFKGFTTEAHLLPGST